MKGTAELTRNYLKEVLGTFREKGAIAVEINAGKFADSCHFATTLDVVCDVLMEVHEKVIQHPGGASGYGRNLVVRIKL